MKNLLVTVGFALFSMTLPLVMAQQVAVVDASDPVQTEVKTKRISDSDNPDASASGSESKRIVIDINTNEATEAKDEIEEAIKTVHELFGEELGAELAREFENLDEDERSKVTKKLKKVFGEDGIHIGGDSGLGFPEFMVAMTAIIFTLGLPVIILVLVLVFSHRKRKQKMALISSYLEANQPVPAYVMAEFGSDSNTNSTFSSGLTFTLVGIAIALFLGVVDDWETAALGLIPIAIGVARLISWKYGNDHNKESA